ncbi:MAG: aminomethyltransferase family protein [Blastocatellia bacterium]|nr:aminomethyltransferase family protein [Blastocatellia bacterium]
MKKSLLQSEHIRHHATITSAGEWEVIADYGDTQSEYKAVRESAGVIDLSHRGRIYLSGKNSVQFLQGLVSNDVKILKPGEGAYAAFLNTTGRIQADCWIYRLEESLLIDTAAVTREWVFKSLEKFVPAGDFFVTDITETTTFLSLQGPHSTKILFNLGAGLVASLEALNNRSVKIAGEELRVFKNSRTGEEGFDLLVEKNAPTVFNALTDAGAKPCGLNALDLLRVEAGIAEYKVDMDDTIILLEAGLEHAVSYKKGCYLGQETIAKIHHRGHGQTAKRLSGIVVQSSNLPAVGTKVFNKDGKEIGYITSSIVSPALNQPVALAYLRRDHFTPGQVHSIEIAGDRIGVEVVELPFYRKTAIEEVR